MKILALGDITDARVVPFLRVIINRARKEHGVDFVIVNGENAGFIVGPTADTAKELFLSGVDCLTGGNHTVQSKSLLPLLEEEERLLRPANFPPSVPGRGYAIYRIGGIRVLVMNLLGQVHIEPNLDSPFHTADRILSREEGNYDISLLDFHAEATGEKLALAHYLDGRVSAVFGTHTHVPTADEQVLPHGTGYVSDLGMSGGSTGILGLRKEPILERMVEKMPARSLPDMGPLLSTGAFFTVDDSTGKTLSVERVRFKESDFCK